MRLFYHLESSTSIAQLPVDTSNFNIHRTTLGLNFALWRQSLLMVNWENWRVPDSLQRSLNVYGVRYAVTF